MELNYQVDKDEFEQWLFWIFRKRMRKINLLMIASCCVMFVMPTMMKGENLAFPIFFALIAAVFLIFSGRGASRRLAEEAMRKEEKNMGIQVRIKLAEDGLHIDSKVEQTVIDYPFIAEIRDYQETLYLKFRNGNYLLIPSSAFDSAGKKEEFRGDLQRRMEKR